MPSLEPLNDPLTQGLNYFCRWIDEQLRKLVLWMLDKGRNCLRDGYPLVQHLPAPVKTCRPKGRSRPCRTFSLKFSPFQWLSRPDHKQARPRPSGIEYFPFSGSRGIGPVGATVLLSAIGDIGDFSDPGKLTAYLGLVPKIQNSNETERSGRITKQGNKLACTTLVQCALIAKPIAGCGREV